MPTSVLEQIADALIAKSAAVPGMVRTGLLTDVGRMWVEEDASMAFYLGLSEEDVEDGPTQSVSPVALFFWHTIIRGDAPTRRFLAALQALKNGLDADRQLGGLCRDARINRVQGFNTSAMIADRVHVTDVFAVVEYRHFRGSA